jgi:hypothetical protein
LARASRIDCGEAQVCFLRANLDPSKRRQSNAGSD